MDNIIDFKKKENEKHLNAINVAEELAITGINFVSRMLTDNTEEVVAVIMSENREGKKFKIYVKPVEFQTYYNENLKIALDTLKV